MMRRTHVLPIVSLILGLVSCTTSHVDVQLHYGSRAVPLAEQSAEPIASLNARIADALQRDEMGRIVLGHWAAGDDAYFYSSGLSEWVDEAVLVHLAGTRHPATRAASVPRTGAALQTSILRAQIVPFEFVAVRGLSTTVALQFTVYRDGDVVGELTGEGTAPAEVAFFTFSKSGVGEQFAASLNYSLQQAVSRSIPEVVRVLEESR